MTRPAPRVVFDAPFSDRSAWAVGRTSAYPEDGRNADDNKLDRIGPGFGPSASGVFRARRAGDGAWDADLVSTEYAPGGFELAPGDEVTATCTLRADGGAWPALWTWGRDTDRGPQPGHGEVDLFEYHSTNPHMLELTNHVGEAGSTVDQLVVPGTPFALRVVLGADDVRWFIDDSLVFADGRGVGAGWRAWLVVNISVSAGGYGHPRPESRRHELSWRCRELKVWRTPAS